MRQLNLYNYSYTEEFCEHSKIDDPQQFGVIAQEVHFLTNFYTARGRVPVINRMSISGVQIRFLHLGDSRSNFTNICNLTSLGYDFLIK